jgi:hypothetical protein
VLNPVSLEYSDAAVAAFGRALFVQNHAVTEAFYFTVNQVVVDQMRRGGAGNNFICCGHKDSSLCICMGLLFGLAKLLNQVSRNVGACHNFVNKYLNTNLNVKRKIKTLFG